MQRQTVVNFFNKVFYDFTDQVKSIDEKLYCKYFKDSIKIRDLDITKHINIFSQSFDTKDFPKLDNSDPFSEDVVKKLKITKMYFFYDLYKELNDNRISIVYLYNFMLFSYLYKLFKDIEESDDEEECELNTLVDTVIIELRRIQNNETDENIIITDENIKLILSKLKNENVEKIDIDKNIDEELKDRLESSTIGSIAKEISSEIDLTNMDIKNPEDIMKLMSGNIIGKVGEKIQKKISSGEIKQQDLLSEAISMLGSMGNNSFLNKDFMKGFGNMSGLNNNKINKKQRSNKKL